jgi:hypothetical protein
MTQLCEVKFVFVAVDFDNVNVLLMKTGIEWCVNQDHCCELSCADIRME